ncbi:MAG: tyrosine--tRNA ligase [Candidatus Woykebacteria bacterium]
MSRLSEIERYINNIYPSKEALEEKLAKRGRLKIYFGIDPTSPQIHIGNAISLLILQQFQKWGHEVLLLFGDFTAQIGDPSGHDTQRSQLSEHQVKENSTAYLAQVNKLLSVKDNPVKIVFNSDWWNKMSQQKFFEVLTHFTVSQLIERDLFQERIKKQRPIAATEFLYPLLQGYDSVALNTDMEIGATDQTFNMLVGRQMVKIYKKKEKFVITTPLLEGTDGRKMSKSFGNTIGIDSDPNDMFGKLMSIMDGSIVRYLKLTTHLPMDEVATIERKLGSSEISPLEAKKKLAFEVVKLYHGEKEAKTAQGEFARVFQQRGVPRAKTKVLKEKIVQATPVEILLSLGMVKSKSEAKRLVEQGGVIINNRRVTSLDERFDVETGSLAQIGKLRSTSVRIVREK